MPHTQAAVTTIDNPFDPFDEFDQWYTWDVSHGYHTTALLGRLVKVSNELSQAVYDKEVETVIDEMITENVSGVYKKVTRQV